MLTFSVPVAYAMTGGVIVGNAELADSDIIVDGQHVYLIPPSPLSGVVCVTFPHAAFINAATGMPFHSDTTLSETCFGSFGDGVATTTTTTTTPTTCDSSLTTAGPIKWELNCSGSVTVNAVCVAVNCPSGGLSVGSMECSASGHMIGVAYCLSENTTVGSIQTVVAELGLTIVSPSAVANTTMAQAVELAVLAALNISDATQVLQFLVQILNVTGGDRRLNRMQSRKLQGGVAYDLSVFFEVYSDAAGTTLANANTLVSGGAEAQLATFTAALSEIGTITDISSIEEPALIERIIGEDGSGTPLFLDTNGNGLVEAVDDTITCDSSVMAGGNYQGDLTCLATIEEGTQCQATNCPEGSTPA
eukprot:2584662-Amphidinium_carterae.1